MKYKDTPFIKKNQELWIVLSWWRSSHCSFRIAKTKSICRCDKKTASITIRPVSPYYCLSWHYSLVFTSKKEALECVKKKNIQNLKSEIYQSERLEIRFQEESRRQKEKIDRLKKRIQRIEREIEKL